MFQGLIDFLWLVFKELFRILLNIFSWLRSYLVILASMFLTLLAVVNRFLDMVWGFFGDIASAVSGLSVQEIYQSPVVDFLSFANMFIPLEENFAHLGIYLSMLIIATTIRVIKSFIPTIS